MTAATLFAPSFAWHALLAGGLVAVVCGLIGPFVISRRMAFAVHGTSELAFSGAAAGLLIAHNPLTGAFGGSLIVAGALGYLAGNERERDSSIGVVLAFGLGLGVLLLGFYHGFATQATNILFGNIFGISTGQLLGLTVVSLAVGLTILSIFRPLTFASVDPAVAAARGVPVRLVGTIFLFALALSVTAAAQVVGTLLVLSLAITPAAAATRCSARPAVITGLAVSFALCASLAGITVSLAVGTLKPSVCVAFASFSIYLFARLLGPLMRPQS